MIDDVTAQLNWRCDREAPLGPDPGGMTLISPPFSTCSFLSIRLSVHPSSSFSSFFSSSSSSSSSSPFCLLSFAFLVGYSLMKTAVSVVAIIMLIVPFRDFVYQLWRHGHHVTHVTHQRQSKHGFSFFRLIFLFYLIFSNETTTLIGRIQSQLGRMRPTCFTHLTRMNRPLTKSAVEIRSRRLFRFFFTRAWYGKLSILRYIQ